MLTEQPPTGSSLLSCPASFLSLLRVSRKPGDTEEISLQNPSCIVTRQNREGALGAQTPGVYKSCQMPSASAGGVEAGAGAKWSPGRKGAKVLNKSPFAMHLAPGQVEQAIVKESKGSWKCFYL
uniref:Uncharacterized protein n=1 Tax=Rangifer tarandus platyrhynchus TaxID=3082113 RepID=A0ACB0EX41_RANTA|nr:unnamed protein product [Rangifer tarandus platyrhynchus]